MARKRVRPKDKLISLYQRFGVVYVDRVSGFPVRGLKLNPFYVDGMRISTSLEGLKLVTEMMARKIRRIKFDVIAAHSISGIPYASILAERLKKRLMIDRGIPTKYGFHRRVEGEVRKGDKVVIVDDIAKRGQTLIDIGEQVRGLGATVAMSLVVVDATTVRERRGLNRRKLKFESLITLEELGVDPNIGFDTSNQA